MKRKLHHVKRTIQPLLPRIVLLFFLYAILIVICVKVFNLTVGTDAYCFITTIAIFFFTVALGSMLRVPAKQKIIFILVFLALLIVYELLFLNVFAPFLLTPVTQFNKKSF